MNRVALIIDRFLDGDIIKGRNSPNIHNVYETLHTYRMYTDLDVYFLDSVTYRAEQVVIDRISNQGTQYSNLIVIPLFGSHKNPTVQSLYTIKALSNTKITYIWPDAIAPSTGKSIDELGAAVDQHIFWDTDQVKFTCPTTKACMLWCPPGQQLFYNIVPYKDRGLERAVFGSLNQPGRKRVYDCLSDKMYIGHVGGARERNLSIEGYSAAMRDTRIVINTSFSLAGDQLKGRVFEATACGCLLFQSASAQTRKYFKPGVEYIEWDTFEDCVNKLEYYSKNTTEAAEIALNGWVRFSENYSDTHFWTQVFNL